MKRRRGLIESPLEWFLSANPVPPPAIPVIAERGGTQLKTPRPVVLVDTREQNPFDFSRFTSWFSGIERRALKLGDYSIAGLEEVCVVERKDLTDLVRSFTAERHGFVQRLQQMSRYPNRLLVVTAALSQVKSPYGQLLRKPKSNHAGPYSIASWLEGAILVHGNTRAGRGAHCLLPVSGAPLQLAGRERIWL